MLTLLRQPVGPADDAVVVAATERDDGDFHPRRTDPVTLARRQRAVQGARWVMADQVHGTAVVRLDATRDRAVGSDRSDIVDRAMRTPADVLVATGSNPPLAVWSADCAPLVLVGRGGTIVAAHAGWRGLAAGIVDVAVDQLVDRGESVAAAVLGPVVHPCCYPFGDDDAAAVARGVGGDVADLTRRGADGSTRLDLPAAVATGLAAHDIELAVVGPCTACDDRWFSHRRGDRRRHAVVAWRERDGLT